MLTKEEKKEILELLNEEINVYIEKGNNIKTPVYASNNDAGVDIRASKKIKIKPNETEIIPTGIKLAIPNGFEIQIRPRSGLSAKTSLRIANSPGTIDSGYRDEIGIIVDNISNEDEFIIEKGDRIAQMVLSKIYKMKFLEIDDVKKKGENRGGGFGHSGIK